MRYWDSIDWCRDCRDGEKETYTKFSNVRIDRSNRYYYFLINFSETFDTVYHSFLSSMYLTEICNSDFSLKEVKIELLVFTFEFVSQFSFSDTTSTIFPVPNVQTEILSWILHPFTTTHSHFRYLVMCDKPPQSNWPPQCSVGWLGWTEQGACGVFCVCGQTVAGTRVTWDLTALNYPERFLYFMSDAMELFGLSPPFHKTPPPNLTLWFFVLQGYFMQQRAFLREPCPSIVAGFQAAGSQSWQAI